MDIRIEWRDSPKEMDLGEKQLPFKKQLGHRSTTLNTIVRLDGLTSKINLKWKQNLARLVSGQRFRSGCHASVTINNRYKFEIHGNRTATDFANRIANLILRTRHSGRDKLGVSKEQILASLKK